MGKVIVPDEVEALAAATVNAALAVHRTFGPGLLESAYEDCLAIELSETGLAVERQVTLPLIYRGRPVDTAYRVDLIVGHKLLVELKAVEVLAPVTKAQVITYRKLLNLPLGLLINFNVPLVKDGIHRILNLAFQSSDPNADSPSRPAFASSRLRC